MDRHAQVLDAVGRLMPGFEVQRIGPLVGGMSAEMLVVDVIGSDLLPHRVVARFPSALVRRLFDDAAEHEMRTLEAVRACGVPAPKPLGLGEAADGRFLLLEYIEGEPIADPEDVEAFIAQFAGALAQIHQVDIAKGGFACLPPTRSLFASRREELNADLREPEVCRALVSAGDQRFLNLNLRHGDFWPGNVLWTAGQITGIIDWENALLGPAIADLSISRLDICWILGPEAMEDFTVRYVEMNPLDLHSLAYWDLRAAIRPMANLNDWAAPYASLNRSDITGPHMRRVLLEFVDSALRRCRNAEIQ